MANYMKEMLDKRKNGIHCGVPSFCCANKLVIEAILSQAKRFGDITLIEATSNQVNQNGGYMDMKPQDFTDYVYKIAKELEVDRDKILIGGDHMGPLPWANEPAQIAMEKAKELVRLCVRAGYKKIHLDTSMRLGDDPKDIPLNPDIIAERGAILYKACEETFLEMYEADPTFEHPVFVIGSEVPVPGGLNGNEIEPMKITEPEEFTQTLLSYRKVFRGYGLENAWDYIIAIVVQPGVEFGDDTVRMYNRVEAMKLCNELKKYPDLVFEGHSTDYQPPLLLKQMVEDGIAIVKVGPALTFSLRESLFALNMIENELFDDESKKSHFKQILEEEMREDNSKWINYYNGTETEKFIKRAYSFSDRSRYYMTRPKVEMACNKLFENIDKVNIPLSLLKQYMPIQYIKVRDGKLELKARELAKDSVVTLVEDYNYAVKYNYMISGIFVG